MAVGGDFATVGFEGEFGGGGRVVFMMSVAHSFPFL